MLQIEQIIVILKKQLKAAGMTYADLAIQLEISEASVKRLFSKKELTLGRLEQICHCLGFNLSDLFEMLNDAQSRIYELTLEQELQLVKEPSLLLVAVCVLNHWQFNDILTYYQFDEFELIQKLISLDRMQFLELLPGNRFKPLVHADFDWISSGPIQQLFQQTVQQDFFDSNFAGSDELLIVRSGMLSMKDNLLLQKKLKETAESFIQACRANKELPIDKRHGTALVIALRQWVPKLFTEMTR